MTSELQPPAGLLVWGALPPQDVGSAGQRLSDSGREDRPLSERVKPLGNPFLLWPPTVHREIGGSYSVHLGGSLLDPTVFDLKYEEGLVGSRGAGYAFYDFPSGKLLGL